MVLLYQSQSRSLQMENAISRMRIYWLLHFFGLVDLCIIAYDSTACIIIIIRKPDQMSKLPVIHLCWVYKVAG